MKRIALGLLVLVAMATAATANQVSLTLVNIGPYQFEGRPSFPFYFSNGMELMPYNYKADSNKAVANAIGLTWLTTEVPVDYFKPGSFERAQAWLYFAARKDGGADPNINGAVFWLTNHNAIALTPAVQAWVNLAEQHASQNFPNTYIFVEARHSGGLQMIGGAPEPSTLLLVGTALLGICGWGRRFLRGV